MSPIYTDVDWSSDVKGYILLPQEVFTYYTLLQQKLMNQALGKNWVNAEEIALKLTQLKSNLCRPEKTPIAKQFILGKFS